MINASRETLHMNPEMQQTRQRLGKFKQVETQNLNFNSKKHKRKNLKDMTYPNKTKTQHSNQGRSMKTYTQRIELATHDETQDKIHNITRRLNQKAISFHSGTYKILIMHQVTQFLLITLMIFNSVILETRNLQDYMQGI